MTEGGGNAGHGHVIPRPDGQRARCGGPGICAICSREAAVKLSAATAAPRPDRQVPVAAWALTALCNELNVHECPAPGPCLTCAALVVGREALKP